MKITRRTSLLLLLILLFLLAILFRSYLLENLVMPVALLFWLLRRVVLSVDQGVYWGLMIFLSAFYFFIRTARTPVFDEPVPQPGGNATLETMRYWRTAILLTGEAADQPDVLKQDLVRLLASIYAAREPDVTLMQTYDALKQRQIPLPASIQAFLFPNESTASRRSLAQIASGAWHTLGKCFRRWTGRDKAAYYRSIEEVLDFMETLMEKNTASEQFNARNH